jgi:hypothetical protein
VKYVNPRIKKYMKLMREKLSQLIKKNKENIYFRGQIIDMRK